MKLTGWCSLDLSAEDMHRVLTKALCLSGIFNELRVRGVEVNKDGSFRVNLRPVEKQTNAAK